MRKCFRHSLLVLATLAASVPGAQASLVEWFKLDEGAINASTNIVYSSASSDTGTTNGNGGTGNLGWATTGLAPVPLSPPANNTPGTVAALSLSGTNAVKTTYPGIGGTTARTVCLWMKGAAGQPNASPTLAGWGPNGTTGARFDLRLSATTSPAYPRIEITSGGSFSATQSNILDNAWHHVAVTYAGGSSGTATLYVDGGVAGSGTLSSVNTTASASTPLLIGDSNADALANSRGRLTTYAFTTRH